MKPAKHFLLELFEIQALSQALFGRGRGVGGGAGSDYIIYIAGRLYVVSLRFSDRKRDTGPYSRGLAFWVVGRLFAGY